MAQFNTGDEVTWTSQAQGCATQKSGTVLGVVGKNGDANALLPANTPKSRINFQRFSMVERYVVSVPRGGKNELVDYYATLASNVVKQLAGTTRK